jgi:hypothetical protein
MYGNDDIVYNIMEMLTGDATHAWSNIHPDKSKRNPPKRQEQYYKAIQGFKDVNNLMVASKRVRLLLKLNKTKSRRQAPYDYSFYNYTNIRERLIMEKSWQAFYTLQNLRQLQLQRNNPNDDGTDDEDPPHWLTERWVSIELYGKVVINRPCPITGEETNPLTRPELYRELNPEAPSFDTIEELTHIQRAENMYDDDKKKATTEIIMRKQKEKTLAARHTQTTHDQSNNTQPNPEEETDLYSHETNIHSVPSHETQLNQTDYLMAFQLQETSERMTPTYLEAYQHTLEDSTAHKDTNDSKSHPEHEDVKIGLATRSTPDSDTDTEPDCATHYNDDSNVRLNKRPRQHK